MPEFCCPQFVKAPEDLEGKLRALAGCLRGVKPGMGVELAPEMRELIREAHHALALRCMHGGAPTPLSVFEGLQVWRFMDLPSTRDVLTAGAVAQEADLVVDLLAVPMPPSGPRPGRRQARPVACDPMADVKARIRELYSQGASCDEICRQLDRQRFRTPPKAGWRNLTWSRAKELNERSVQVWISKAAGGTN